MSTGLVEQQMISDGTLADWLNKGDEWERMNSRRAETRFRAMRQRENQEKREARNTETLDERVVTLIGDLRIISIAGLPASAIGRSSRSTDAPLPFIDEGVGYLSPTDTRHFLANLGSDADDDRWEAVLALENAIGFSRFEANQTSDDKDSRILKEFAGYTPHEVVTLAPSLGSMSAIRQVRTKADLDPETGEK
jgi:hypothetical protein